MLIIGVVRLANDEGFVPKYDKFMSDMTRPPLLKPLVAEMVCYAVHEDAFVTAHYYCRPTVARCVARSISVERTSIHFGVRRQRR